MGSNNYNGSVAMRRIVENDPTFTEIEIDDYDDYHDLKRHDWGDIGRAIGMNKHLRDVSLLNYDFLNNLSFDDVADFLNGFAMNRSIRKLKITGWDFDWLYYYDKSTLLANILNQFFINNQAFECLVVDTSYEYKDENFTDHLSQMCDFAVQLLRNPHPFFCLQEFELTNSDTWKDDLSADDVINVLIGHNSLRRLTISNIMIDKWMIPPRFDDNHPPKRLRQGCKALAALLKNPRSNLRVLTLNCNKMTNQGARTFAAGLRRNSTLKELEIVDEDDMNTSGWRWIFAALLSSKCRLEKVRLEYTANDATTLLLTNVLLQNSATLKTLCLIGSHNAMTADFFRFLTEPNSALEELILGTYFISDDAIVWLANALSNNRRLKKFSLTKTYNPSDNPVAGLVAFSNVLQNPNSALEMLDLSGNNISDQTLASFAQALTSNKRLRELVIGFKTHSRYNEFKISDGYTAFCILLCNKLSIMDTYQSNHVLEKFFYLCGPTEYDELMYLLDLNAENSEKKAARLKIIMTHFNGPEICMQPFIDMDLSTRPQAIAWMVRDKRGYQLLRAMPSLLEKFEGGGNVMSRKRPLDA
jgi:hypothetical protein